MSGIRSSEISPQATASSLRSNIFVIPEAAPGLLESALCTTGLDSLDSLEAGIAGLISLEAGLVEERSLVPGWQRAGGWRLDLYVSAPKFEF
ncbi:hypothetical protein SARC_05477 [Sphaeroforma arctica JP610]|uniref:Uncharacterized protein n=1 Tax=Sphaeroforma arctica JP610 TaxID=667725 RepID=A0A0L0FZI8_9EUKA|nr:hypothetical protein SARC_05477 [Sphaeroforma arctica JP610]KNC82235.1 hypothetical protein SARC_05477 [Sphaeroforma arctica JP610]|eukprot:XP_014156137.1 hypothetical protein SARC_05477 [Sphaeroforma arctica JP610]